MGEKRGTGFRNLYEGHRNRDKEGWDRGWEVGMARVGGCGGGKRRQLYLNTNKKNRLRKIK